MLFTYDKHFAHTRCVILVNAKFITADSVQYCLASADVRRLSFNICGVFSKQITEELCMSHGHKVLLVLDGFDEISHSFHGNSIVKDILCKQVLPACTIVLNTRPSASHVLDYFCQPQLDKHVEIVGFKEEERLKYKHELEYQVNFLKYIHVFVATYPVNDVYSTEPCHNSKHARE